MESATSSEDDNVSLASTIDEEIDPDQDWVTEGIIAEATRDDAPVYLTDWEGYPLHDATWEPMEHLHEDDLKKWADKHITEADNKAQIKKWIDARLAHLKARRKRHQVRNAKRRKVGQQPVNGKPLAALFAYVREWRDSQVDSDSLEDSDYNKDERRQALPIDVGSFFLKDTPLTRKQGQYRERSPDTDKEQKPKEKSVKPKEKAGRTIEVTAQNATLSAHRSGESSAAFEASRAQTGVKQASWQNSHPPNGLSASVQKPPRNKDVDSEEDFLEAIGRETASSNLARYKGTARPQEARPRPDGQFKPRPSELQRSRTAPASGVAIRSSGIYSAKPSGPDRRSSLTSPMSHLDINPLDARPPQSPLSQTTNLATQNVFVGGKKRKTREEPAAADKDESDKRMYKRLSIQHKVNKRSRDSEGTRAPSTIPKNLILLGKEKEPESSTNRLLEPNGSPASRPPESNGKPASPSEDEDNLRHSPLSVTEDEIATPLETHTSSEPFTSDVQDPVVDFEESPSFQDDTLIMSPVADIAREQAGQPHWLTLAQSNPQKKLKNIPWELELDGEDFDFSGEDSLFVPPHPAESPPPLQYQTPLSERPAESQPQYREQEPPIKGPASILTPATGCKEQDDQTMRTNGAAPMPLKRKKSVTFDLPPDHREHEDGANSVSGAHLRSSSEFQTSKKHIPAEPIRRGSNWKAVRIGQTSSEFELEFSVLFALPEGPYWLTDFRAATCLKFEYICSAQDFQAQIDFRSHAVQWTAEVPSHAQIIMGHLLDKLKIPPSGILCHHETFCALIYPAKNEAWDFLGPVGAKKGSHTLGVCMFAPNASLPLSQMLLKPVESLEHPPRFQSTSQTQGLPNMLGGIDYQGLIPKDIDRDAEHCFYLLFPRPNEMEVRMIVAWIDYHYENCKILLLSMPGQWENFAKRQDGTVIIHEDALQILRQVPRLFSLLAQSRHKFNFWLFPRIVTTRPGASIQPGDFRLQPVLATSNAILLTPSFLLSQPHAAYRLVSEFDRRRRQTRDKLIVAPGVVSWIYQLLAQKSATRDAAINRNRGKDTSSGIITERMKIAELFRKLLHDSRDKRYEDRAVVCGVDHIDASDEQSLVNWFTYDMLSHVQHFRQFTVLGSSDRYSTEGDADAMTIRLKTLRYADNTVADYESAFRQLEPAPDLAPESERTPEELREEIHQRLEKARKVMRRAEFAPGVFYYQPIGGPAPVMFACRDDPEAMASSYRPWMEYLKPDKRNTYFGFFCTSEDEPRLNAMQHPVPQAHYWTAILRPVNPHFRPWNECELLILDVGGPGRARDERQLYESDLTKAQRHLARFAGQQAPHLAFNLPLKRVWFGCFEDLVSSSTPLDQALAATEAVVQDFKKWLPPYDAIMEQRGWRFVEPGQRLEPPRTPMSAVNGSAPNETSKEVMICHPPRGRVPGFASRCRNRLYEASKDARRSGQKEFEFTFLPTEHWYREQVEEGRGCEHVRVMTWEDFTSEFGEYKLEEASSATGSGTGSNGEGSADRMDTS